MGPVEGVGFRVIRMFVPSRWMSTMSGTGVSSVQAARTLSTTCRVLLP